MAPFADATAHSNARFGAGTGSIFLDNVACTGEEVMLTSCAYDSNTGDCFHSDDAGVTCVPDCKFHVKFYALICNLMLLLLSGVC